MTVSELIQALLELPGELEVWTATDDEGNRYNELNYSPSIYVMHKDAEYSVDGLGCTSEDNIEDPGELEAMGLELEDLKRVVVI